MNANIRIAGTPLNPLGFRGPSLDPKAKYRVIVLGDSTSFGFINGSNFFVHEAYPNRLQQLAEVRNGPGTLSVLNASVCGYNSYHGIMLLRTKLRSTPADLIVVQYGWNDLLTTTAYTGSSAFREPTSALARAGEEILLRTAMYPFAIRLRMELDQRWGGSRTGTPPNWQPLAQWTPNVTVEDYEHNLRRIVALAQSHGSQVWLMTSPDAFTTTDYAGKERDFGVTAALQLGFLQYGGIHTFEELDAIHARYNDAVRRVGAELAVPVVDIEATFRAHASEHLFLPIDAIHPTDAGHVLEAADLYSRLTEKGVLTRPGTAP
jgi:lysophospholipase L1-like esterase